MGRDRGLIILSILFCTPVQVPDLAGGVRALGASGMSIHTDRIQIGAPKLCDTAVFPSFS